MTISSTPQRQQSTATASSVADHPHGVTVALNGLQDSIDGLSDSVSSLNCQDKGFPKVKSDLSIIKIFAIGVTPVLIGLLGWMCMSLYSQHGMISKIEAKADAAHATALRVEASLKQEVQTSEANLKQEIQASEVRMKESVAAIESSVSKGADRTQERLDLIISNLPK